MTVVESSKGHGISEDETHHTLLPRPAVVWFVHRWWLGMCRGLGRSAEALGWLGCCRTTCALSVSRAFWRWIRHCLSEGWEGDLVVRRLSCCWNTRQTPAWQIRLSDGSHWSSQTEKDCNSSSLSIKGHLSSKPVVLTQKHVWPFQDSPRWCWLWCSTLQWQYSSRPVSLPSGSAEDWCCSALPLWCYSLGQVR